MVRPVNIGKRGLVQVLAPSFLLLSIFSGAEAWEEVPFGSLTTTTATLDVAEGRVRRFIFSSETGSTICPHPLCFRRGLEPRHGESFVIERDSRGQLFSVSDSNGPIVSLEEIRAEFLKDLGWATGWFLLSVLCVLRLLRRKCFSDE